jgi:hypothetical protein
MFERARRLTFGLLSWGSKMLYRQPASLICTDLDLDLQTLVQSYLYRWEIECNHRDEKSLLGVAQGQVWNRHAVRRLPQLQVAGYSLLLLASLLSSGFQRTAEYTFPCRIGGGNRFVLRYWICSHFCGSKSLLGLPILHLS